MGKRVAALDNLNNRLAGGDNTDIILMQEPVVQKNRRIKGPNGGHTFHSSKQLIGLPIRSAIWVRNSLIKSSKSNCFLLEQFSDRDNTTIRTKFTMNDGDTIDIIICSSYCPSIDNNNRKIDNPISPILNKVINFCKANKLELILAGDFNAHSVTWGGSRNDVRGKHILDFLMKQSLICLNDGSTATFAVGGKQSFIDLTLTSRRTHSHIKNWLVNSDYSGSDHRIISFELSSSTVIPKTFRNRRKVRWKKFQKIFVGKIGNANFDSNSPEELDLAANSFKDILMETFEESCKLVAVKDKFYMNWYNNKLHEEKKVVRKLPLFTLFRLHSASSLNS